MGRAPCCDKANVKKGPWSPEEDAILKEYIEKHSTGGNWIALPHKAGLRRCGKSCRLRWLNYLRPNIKHGEFSEDEDRLICSLFASIGSRWSIIAAQLPGRTDNDIKNYWNTKLKKKLIIMGMAPSIQYPKKPHQIFTTFPSISNNNNSLLQNSLIASPFSSLHSQTPSVPSYEYGNSNFCTTSTFTTVNSSNSDGFVGPTAHGNYNQGNKEPSCSSSDGSCITNQIINHGGDQNNYCFQSYLTSGVNDDQDQKLFLFSTTNDGYSSSLAPPAAANGCFSTEDNPLDHSIEEIKHLISTNCNNNLNFFVDEIKTEDQ